MAGSRERARSYVETVLHEADWSITHQDYRTPPSLLRTSDLRPPLLVINLESLGYFRDAPNTQHR